MDIRDWVTAVATAAAAVFAAWTIRQAKKQAQRSAAALVRERRIDWELGLLKEIAEAAEGDDSWHSQLGLRLLGDKRLPILRAAVGMETTPEAKQFVTELHDARGTARQAQSPLVVTREDVRQEIDEEITRLLDERERD
jgi:hypothetical protein